MNQASTSSVKHPATFAARDYGFQGYVDVKNWIDGQWKDAISGATMPVFNPRHGQEMGRVVVSGREDVAQAVAAAKKAFPAWKATPMKERAQILYRLKALMERDVEELTYLLSHENGKVYAQAKGSVMKGIECVEMGCSLPNMVGGGQLDVSRGISCRVSYEPLGVCAGIAPFNFPTMVPLWMLPQALVAGNTFVLKPSETGPYGSMKIAALLDEAGLPPGVLNLVNGTKEAVEGIVDHPDVKAVGFVGSSTVAQIVYARASALGKRALCLGSAKNPLIVVPDADKELTADTVSRSAFGSSGQRCMAASMMFAVGDVQPIIDRLVEISKGIKLGEDIGSITSPESKARMEGFVSEAEKLGAKVLLDGRAATLEGNPGWWVGPTIVDHVTSDMPIFSNELFGPVLSIVRCKTIDEALALENSLPYGNAAGIFTTSGATARYALERFEAGMCGVNIGVPVPREPFSFGGWNASKFGHGDMTGFDGFRFWTRPRKVTSKWAISHDETWMS